MGNSFCMDTFVFAVMTSQTYFNSRLGFDTIYIISKQLPNICKTRACQNMVIYACFYVEMLHSALKSQKNGSMKSWSRRLDANMNKTK